MTRPRRKRLSRRQKIWVSLAASVAGTALLVGIALVVQATRETDTTDPTAGLTNAFRGGGDVGAPPIRFTDVAAEAGVIMRHGPGARARTLPEDTGSGLAWGDVDGDGDFDLYVVNFPGTDAGGPDASPGNRLFRNDAGHFTDISQAAGVADAAGFGMGATFADYDGDGDVDLYVSNFGPNRLFRNRGDGTFEDVAHAAGVADVLWSTGATWGDYDRDGDLDLYVCNYVKYDVEGAGDIVTVGTAQGRYEVPFALNPNAFDPEPNRLYRNRGDGTFEEVAVDVGAADESGRSLGAAFCDLDGDGWLDLYVNNDVSPNALLRSTGARGGKGVRFADIGVTTGSADPRGSMGLSMAELGVMGGKPDELPDLFITHWVAQENAFYVSMTSRGGALEYRDKTRRLRLGEISLDRVGWGSALVDLDRDGRLDIGVANGSTLEVKGDPTRLVAEPIFLLWNTGTAFADVAPAAGDDLRRAFNARGLAAADYDGDGDVDLAVAVNRGAPLLLRNDTATENRGLAVRLDAPAALAFGARIRVVTTGHEGPPDIRWWGADVSWCSGHAPEMIFGLGAAAEARVEVTWADGRRTVLEHATPGRVRIAYPR